MMRSNLNGMANVIDCINSQKKNIKTIKQSEGLIERVDKVLVTEDNKMLLND